MEAGRAWWVILSTENCNHAGAGWVKMNWGHWRPGAGLDVPWSKGGRVLIWEGVGLEGNTEGVSRFLLLMNLFAWAQDWRALHLYPVYTRIRFIILPFFFVTYERYKPNYFENRCIILSLAIKC